MKPDPAILSLLNLGSAETTLSSGGGGGMSSASTSRITAKHPDGTTQEFFVKSGHGHAAEVMFAGEHASLTAIHEVVPSLCPKSFGHGKFQNDPEKSFVVTDFLELSRRTGGRRSSNSRSGMTLAQKLAKLHTTPAPIPQGYDRPQFGFPVPTCCGDTQQDNTFSSSWADFYANRRLRFITKQSTKNNGKDKELESLVEQTCTSVIPKLISNDHLNNGKGITPVVVHGDLWSGNASQGRLPGMAEPEQIAFDSSACYAHNEYELGIMRMFGGFSGFHTEYHALVPKTEPTKEYDDRVKLYELYHHLNHHAMFGGGYRSGAVGIMKQMISKYG